MKLKVLKKLCLEIRSVYRGFPKKYFFIKNLINELVLLNLKIEQILFDKKNKDGNPIILAIKLLNELKQRLGGLLTLKIFCDNKKKINIEKFIREKTHKNLFQDLWTNFNYQEYLNERIKRYLLRIKLNNLKNYYR